MMEKRELVVRRGGERSYKVWRTGNVLHKHHCIIDDGVIGKGRFQTTTTSLACKGSRVRWETSRGFRNGRREVGPALPEFVPFTCGMRSDHS